MVEPRIQATAFSLNINMEKTKPGSGGQTKRDDKRRPKHSPSRHPFPVQQLGPPRAEPATTLARSSFQLNLLTQLSAVLSCCPPSASHTVVLLSQLQGPCQPWRLLRLTEVLCLLLRPARQHLFLSLHQRRHLPSWTYPQRRILSSN